jgi:hypothetical protein
MGRADKPVASGEMIPVDTAYVVVKDRVVQRRERFTYFSKGPALPARGLCFFCDGFPVLTFMRHWPGLIRGQ